MSASDAVLASIHCGGLLQNTTLLFSYDVYQFTSGNVFASAGVREGAIGASYANFYAPTQNGALTASVIVSLDEFAPADGGWWQLSLDRTTLVTSIVYNDVDVAGGMVTWTMSPTACVVNRY
jgi:hypothetical protein